MFVQKPVKGEGPLVISEEEVMTTLLAEDASMDSQIRLLTLVDADINKMKVVDLNVEPKCDRK